MSVCKLGKILVTPSLLCNRTIPRYALCLSRQAKDPAKSDCIKAMTWLASALTYRLEYTSVESGTWGVSCQVLLCFFGTRVTGRVRASLFSLALVLNPLVPFALANVHMWRDRDCQVSVHLVSLCINLGMNVGLGRTSGGGSRPNWYVG